MARKVNIHRLTRTEGKINWIPCTGEEIDFNGHTLVYVEDIDMGHNQSDKILTNVLIEPQTGLCVFNGKNKPTCIDGFKQ